MKYKLDNSSHPFLARQKVQEDLWRCLLWSINICIYLPKQCVQRKIENIKLGRDRRAHNAAEVVGNRRNAFFCQLCSFIIQQKLLLIAKPFVWTIDMMQAGTRGTLRLWVVMDFAWRIWAQSKFFIKVVWKLFWHPFSPFLCVGLVKDDLI